MSDLTISLTAAASPANYSGGWATLSELHARLTQFGTGWHVDVDVVNGTGSESELAAYAVPALQYADSLVDAAVVNFIASINNRPQNNWLRDRSVDIAAYRVFSLGGRLVPEPLELAYRQTLEWLEAARNKELTVPGLVHVSEVLAGGNKGSQVPTVANVE